jgi:NAD(P)-dependent dehydrogenase (short-subunit alcohol dehydrogenase family)
MAFAVMSLLLEVSFIYHTLVFIIIDQVVVYPSEMTSANMANMEQDAGEELPASVVPEQRMGDDRDISGAVLFLASRAGAYCNGSVLVTDGGRLSVTPASY